MPDEQPIQPHTINGSIAVDHDRIAKDLRNEVINAHQKLARTFQIAEEQVQILINAYPEEVSVHIGIRSLLTNLLPAIRNLEGAARLVCLVSPEIQEVERETSK